MAVLGGLVWHTLHWQAFWLSFIHSTDGHSLPSILGSWESWKNKASHLHGNFSPVQETSKHLDAQGGQGVERTAGEGVGRMNTD